MENNNNSEQIDLGIGLVTNARFPPYFSYDDLISWCDSKKNINLTSYIADSMYLCNQLPTNRNALIQFIIDFGRFFDNKYLKMYEDKCNEFEEYKKQEKIMEFPKIKW